jgi:hypothetical protein
MLLPLTLGWKVAADRKPTYTTKDIVVEFLKRHNFDIVVTDQMILNDLPLIHASAGTCRMFVVEVAPGGWNREAIRDLGKTMDRLFTVNHGKISTEQSTSLTVTKYWWSKYIHKLGIGGDIIPQIAVGATISCNAEQLPWDELNNPVLLTIKPHK